MIIIPFKTVCETLYSYFTLSIIFYIVEIIDLNILLIYYYIGLKFTLITNYSENVLFMLFEYLTHLKFLFQFHFIVCKKNKKNIVCLHSTFFDYQESFLVSILR